MLNLGLIILAYVACWYVIGCIRKEVNIIQSFVFASVGYLFSHIVLSGLLLWIDQYSIVRTLIMCILFWWILAVMCIVKHKKPHVTWQWKQYIIPLIICLLAFPIIQRPFGFYGMGQDEGVYQTQAILFMNHITKRQYDYEEYYMLDTDEEREVYERAVSPDMLAGAYSAQDELFPAISERATVFHGLGTYSALLALCGSILGMHRMMNINGFMYILVIFMVSEIADCLKLKAVGKICTLSITAFCPLMLWLSKSALTEVGQTLILMSFLYLMLQDDTESIISSGICIAVYAFYHVSLYAFMPLYVCLYMWMFIKKKDKRYLIADIISIAGYLTGFWYGLSVSYKYVTDNYVKQIRHLLTKNELIICVSLVCIALLLCLGIIYKYNARIENMRGIQGVRNLSDGKKRAIIIAVGGVAILCLILQLLKKGNILNNIPEITLVAYLILGGIVGPLCVYISVVFFTKKWLQNDKYELLLILFMYCIIIFGCFMVIRSHYFYYYARYLNMYIPIVAIMAGIIFDRIRVWISIGAFIIQMVYFYPYDKCLLTYSDDTLIEWDVLYSMSETLEQGDVVILPAGEYRKLYLPLKALTDADIYPMDTDIIQSVQAKETGNRNIYYIAPFELTGYADIEEVKLIRYNESEDKNVKSMDYQNPMHDRYTHMPRKYSVAPKTYFVYQ